MPQLQKTRTILVDKYSDRFDVETVICPRCEQVSQIPAKTAFYPMCVSCRGTLRMNLAEYKRIKRIKEIDTFTLCEWFRILPNMIFLNRKRKRPHITLFLVNKWVSLKLIRGME